MQSIHQVEQVEESTTNSELAEVITLPTANVGSFYQRRGTHLPRISSNGESTYTRDDLPSPVAAEPDTIYWRLKNFVRVNRPGWLPQK